MAETLPVRKYIKVRIKKRKKKPPQGQQAPDR
jgi:hypothetical protein